VVAYWWDLQNICDDCDKQIQQGRRRKADVGVPLMMEDGLKLDTRFPAEDLFNTTASSEPISGFSTHAKLLVLGLGVETIQTQTFKHPINVQFNEIMEPPACRTSFAKSMALAYSWRFTYNIIT
jgi:hypothetical protein